MKITRSRTGFLFSSVTLWLAWAVAAIPATAQTPEFGTLLNFTGGPDGMTPVGALVEYGGIFYGKRRGGAVRQPARMAVGPCSRSRRLHRLAPTGPGARFTPLWAATTAALQSPD